MGSSHRCRSAFALTLVIAAALVGCRRGGCAKSHASSADESRSHAASGETGRVSHADRSGLPKKMVRPGDPGAVDVTFDIRADREVRRISPLIYGINGDLKSGAEQRWRVIRLGGNRATAYNWENNASNAGSDWQFQNDALVSTSDSPALPTLAGIDAAAAIPAAVIVTVSNAPYVAADKNGGGDVRASGPDYLATRFKRNHAKKKTPFAEEPDKTDGDVYQDEMVAYLRRKKPKAKVMFAMDNEPDLWSHTHAEIFPQPVSYAELWQRNRDFAKATKDAWPGVEVLGPVSYGFQGFVSLQNAPDAGGRNFLEWYLAQAKAAEAKEGRRLIDYLDLHWYPEAMGGDERIVGDGVSPAVVAAREQAPRSLWDPDYKEKSWVADAMGGPIRLLPWVQAKIKAHYLGTKLAITEWNYGGGGHISGAIAVADVLGIFGRHGVALATYWAVSSDESFAFAAYRAFTNYDGMGGAFGDTSIEAKTTDVETATVYASIDSLHPERTVIVAINKASSAKKAGFRLFHPTRYQGAKVFVLNAGEPRIAVRPGLGTIAINAFAYEMPAQSVSVLVPQP